MSIRVALSIIAGFTFFYALHPSSGNADLPTTTIVQAGKPDVKLEIGASGNLTWGQRVRYSIHVEDETDGSSRYGEINSIEVFLNVRYVSDYKNSASLKDQAKSDLYTAGGLALLGKSTCFGCHSDENKMTGPSFSEIADAYKNDANRQEQLVKSVKDGSSGKWGEVVMPPTVTYNDEEISKIVDYILQQGSCTTCWVYQGAEGVLEVMEKPDQNSTGGAYVLTASYTSSAGEQGLDTIVLPVQ
ncbi:c-type cytochrome [Rhodohalobacter sp. 614A]|uniref:c-type cytochrome n=1 Tax=Rhodohalobacter sp. 614A TaxID=2908649 RepID=UPI001F236919|nr:c-type cytochrome [Rhodohalobacter sp. 614A]